jgi:NAD(P)-dependent dehydrogenase (short-subunit alcohol dehydrogenase family)
MSTARLPDRPRTLITGAASGLGRAFALNLAQRKARLLLTDIDLAGAERTAAEAKDLGAEAFAMALDVTDPAAFERAADALDARFGGTDLSIHNAGVAVAGPVGDVSLADWDFVLRVNLMGVVYGCHVFAPRFRAAGRGAILNVASAAAFAAIPEMGPYNVSKAAVLSLTETLRAELAPHGVHVSALCPTFFPTNLMQSFRAPSERQRRLAEALFRRASTTAEAVAAAGLEGLERGRLVTVPQADGRLVRAVKGLAPELYTRVLSGPAFRRFTDRLMGA